MTKKDKGVKDKEFGFILKNSDLKILSNCEGLKNLRESKDLPIGFSFKLAILIEKIQVPMRAFMTQEQKLIDKYADRNKKGKLVQPNPGEFLFTKKRVWFQKEFNELLSLETTINASKLEIAITDIPQGYISADDMIALKSIITIKT